MSLFSHNILSVFIPYLKPSKFSVWTQRLRVALCWRAAVTTVQDGAGRAAPVQQQNSTRSQTRKITNKNRSSNWTTGTRTGPDVLPGAVGPSGGPAVLRGSCHGAQPDQGPCGGRPGCPEAAGAPQTDAGDPRPQRALPRRLSVQPPPSVDRSTRTHGRTGQLSVREHPPPNS